MADSGGKITWYTRSLKYIMEDLLLNEDYELLKDYG